LLLVDLSAAFVHVPIHQVDGAITCWLERIVRCLDIDRSTFFQFTGEDETLRVTHSWAMPGFSAAPPINIRGLFPWTENRILRGEPVVFARVDDLPAEAWLDKESIRHYGAKANAIIPLTVAGKTIGILTAAALRSERVWPKRLVHRLHLVGQVFANALQRKRAQERIEELLGFEHLLADLSAGLIDLPVDDLDDGIAQGLRRSAEFLQMDRAVLYEFAEGEATLQAVQAYVAPGVPPTPARLRREAVPSLFDRVLRGERVAIGAVSDVAAAPPDFQRHLTEQGIQSLAVVPLRGGGGIRGCVGWAALHARRDWPAALLRRMGLVGEILGSGLARRRSEVQLRAALGTIGQLKERLQQENLYLQQEVKVTHNFQSIVGSSRALAHTLHQVEQVAGTGTTVLLLGETGTGKEMLARAIHALSPRRARVLVKVNCAALPSTLVENELFGREKGAYTGALTRQVGRFELADGSTLFLDEIGDLPPETQVKLLRVLQDGEFERLGSTRTLTTDVRVIAATNRDLAQAVQEGRFREDLYYRLNVFAITVPPLRERPDDIPQLVWAFVQEFTAGMGKAIDTIPRAVVDGLQRYPWPGNIRELRNVIERAVITSRGSTLDVQVPPLAGARNGEPPILTLAEVERRHIGATLDRTQWRVRGAHGAAALLGLKATTLEARMQKLGIHRHKRPRSHAESAA
jgi:transcriptional regulator with GAF, ATPase, and Fis domain